jgi:intraflagellar transport protein 46
MKPTIIEDSESDEDEDAIVSAKNNNEENNLQIKQTMKMPMDSDPLLAATRRIRNNQAEDLQQQNDQQELDNDEENDEENDGEDDDDDDDDDVAAPPPEGMYDPSEFDHLSVSAEIKELFSHILRYTPQAIELETRFKPFIPEFIPAVGDIDAFIKVSRPDTKDEMVGLSVLDEPAARQSDPSVLDLQLRAISKHSTQKQAMVKKIDNNSDKSAKAIEQWIKDISDLHRSKPPPSVHYTKSMPDIDYLMQEWPSHVEEMLKETGLPTADFDCDVTTYVDIICSLLDIPIHKSRIQSLHVFFSLYSAFKHSQHFNQLAQENNMDNMAFDEETGQML